MDLDGLSEDTRQAIDGMLRGGQKIKAIKRVREETGSGLKEAKEAVEAYARANGIEAASGSSGCLVILFAIATGLVGFAIV